MEEPPDGEVLRGELLAVGGDDDDGAPGRNNEETDSLDDETEDYFARLIVGLKKEKRWKIDIDEGSPISHLSDEELERLVEVVEDREELILYGHGLPDAEAVRKAASVASRLAGLRTLIFSLHAYDQSRLRRSEWVLACQRANVFLDVMALTSKARIRKLCLTFLGGSPDSWRRFADRFAPAVESLDLSVTPAMTDALASEVALSLHSGFPLLEEFKLQLSVGPRRVSVEATKQLLRAARRLPGIKALHFYTDSERPDDSVTSELANFSRSLKTLRVHSFEGGIRNGFALLRNALSSECLEEFFLDGSDNQLIPLVAPGDFHHDHNRAINYTVKKLSLLHCRLGSESVFLISCFKGLECIEFDETAIDISSYPLAHMWNIFADLDKLVSFSDRYCDVMRISERYRGLHYARLGHHDRVSWATANLLRAPSIQKVSLDYCVLETTVPDLDKLVKGSLSGPGDLSFALRGDGNALLLCAGIEAAKFLTHLRLDLLEIEHATVASILESVQRNTSLRRFEAKLLVDLQHPAVLDCCLPRLEALLSSDSGLEHFGFSLGSFVFEEEASEVAVFAIRGLRRNRRLRTIDFVPPTLQDEFYNEILTVPEDISTEILAMLRECNTSLQRIEGVRYESSQHEEQINSLLALNERGQDFVENARRVPMELWDARFSLAVLGDFLNRIDKRECNYFVTELARRALYGGGRGASPRGPSAREA